MEDYICTTTKNSKIKKGRFRRFMAVLVRVAGDLVQKVFKNIPAHDDCVRICKEEGFYAGLKWTNGWLDSIEVSWESLALEGDAAKLDDETLCFIYDAYGFEEEFKKLGYKVTVIQVGEDTVDFDEL